MKGLRSKSTQTFPENVGAHEAVADYMIIVIIRWTQDAEQTFIFITSQENAFTKQKKLLLDIKRPPFMHRPHNSRQRKSWTKYKNTKRFPICAAP